MTARRTLATARRDLLQIGHDPRTIALLLVVPSLLIGLVAWIFDETEVFADISNALVGTEKQFAIVLDGQVLSAPTMEGRRMTMMLAPDKKK